MSTEAQISEADAKWAAYQNAPKFHHVIREIDGKLSRESYVYWTPEGSIELWRTPSPTASEWHPTGYYGGVEVHGPEPRWEGHAQMSGHCQWVKGGACYSDGSSLAFDTYERDFDNPEYIKSELIGWHRDNLESAA